MATKLLALFTERLASRSRERGFGSGRWMGAPTCTANMLYFGSAPSRTLLYVKVRTDGSGFWGLNDTQLDGLRRSRLPWYVVLIVGPLEDCYLMPSDEVEDAIRERAWSRSSTDWKIHEGDDLNRVRRFRTIEEVIAELLA